MKRMNGLEILLAFALVFSWPYSVLSNDHPVDPETVELKAVQSEAMAEAMVNYWHDFAAINENGSINVVIEISAGMVEKWEVTRDGSALKQDVQDGQLRVIDYLSYPVNYGMVPQTLLSKTFGGDGDPLDVLVIGAPLAQKQVVAVEVIGLMKLLDRGQKDDKLIAVVPGSNFTKIKSLDNLEQSYPGILLIIKTWFSNYKGPGKMEFIGFADSTEAMGLIRQANQSYLLESHLE